MNFFSTRALFVFSIFITQIFWAHGAVYEIMSYNVQNLFDTYHDPGKNDWTFLPQKKKREMKACSRLQNFRRKKKCLKVDWNHKKLQLKLNQIKKVVLKKEKEKGKAKLPHFLALSEVENKEVVSLLAQSLGYREFQLSHGPDKRGIDLALLYNPSPTLVFQNKREHFIQGKYFKKNPTRPILEVEFKIGPKAQESLTLFINHWPSQHHPSQARFEVAKTLFQRIDQIMTHNPRQLVIATGDFNTLPNDYPHPFKGLLLKNKKLIDVHEAFEQSPLISSRQKMRLPPGTYFYTKDLRWELLDRIFVSPHLQDGKGSEIDLSSYQIYAPSFLTGVYEHNEKQSPLFGSRFVGIPKKYNLNTTHPKRQGYSDHFPLILKIKTK